MNNSANIVAIETVDDALLLAVHTQADGWVLDSGASYHTTSHQEIMINYVANDFENVYLANGESLNIVGLIYVRIKQPNGSVWILQKVRHISKLKKNLISIGQLDDCSHSINFRNGEWKVTKGVMVIAWGNKSTLYMTIDPSNVVAIVKDNNDAGQWHNRLGHMS